MDIVFQHTESDNMKKQTLKWMLVLVLIVCFAAALPGLSAAADNIGDLTVGEDIGTMLIYASPLEIESCNLTSGGLPNGLKLYWDATSVYLTGKPGTEGSYSAVYTIQTTEGAVDVTVVRVDVVLVADGVAGAAGARHAGGTSHASCDLLGRHVTRVRAAALDDEARNVAVELEAIVELGLGELAEVGHVNGRAGAVEADADGALAGADDGDLVALHGICRLVELSSEECHDVPPYRRRTRLQTDAT